MGIARVNPADIMQAVETALVAAGVVGDASNIHWVMSGDDAPAHVVGQRDILIEWSDDGVNIRGGCRLDTVMEGTLSVYLRTSRVADRVGTAKQWLIDHYGKRDLVIDALLRLFLTDTGDRVTGNAMTIYGLNLQRLSLPQREHKSPTWGESVGSYKLEYLPKIDVTTNQD